MLTASILAFRTISDEDKSTMGLRTAEQYRSSLRDGRAVFFRGEKVADVTTHPVIGIAVEHAGSRKSAPTRCSHYIL
jgi:hypothetical protein